MTQSDKTKWVNAMEKDMESLHTNEVWELGSKWVFKTKKGANGTIERHKGRLVAQGYSQRYGQAPVSQRTVEVASNGCHYCLLKWRGSSAGGVCSQRQDGFGVQIERLNKVQVKFSHGIPLYLYGYRRRDVPDCCICG